MKLLNKYQVVRYDLVLEVFLVLFWFCNHWKCPAFWSSWCFLWMWDLNMFSLAHQFVFLNPLIPRQSALWWYSARLCISLLLFVVWCRWSEIRTNLFQSVVVVRLTIIKSSFFWPNVTIDLLMLYPKWLQVWLRSFLFLAVSHFRSSKFSMIDFAMSLVKMEHKLPESCTSYLLKFPILTCLFCVISRWSLLTRN